MYKDYLIKNGHGQLLDQNERHGSLDEQQRKRLINISTQFIVFIYGDSPTKKEKSVVAAVIYELFSCLPVVRSRSSNLRTLLISLKIGFPGSVGTFERWLFRQCDQTFTSK